MANKAVGFLTFNFGANMGGFNKAMRKAQRSVGKFGKSMKRIGSSMTTNLTMPLLAVGAAGVKLAVDFGSSMTKIRTLVGASAEELKSYEKSVLALSQKTGVAADELAQGLFFITSAGLSGKEAIEALEVSAKGAAMGMGEMADIGNALTSIMTAYKDEGMTAAKGGDLLHETLKQGKFEASEFMQKLGKVIPTAAAAGISFEELGAAAATMSKLSGDAAGTLTSINSLMMKLLKPSAQQEEILDHLKISAEDLGKMMDESLMGTLQFLFKNLKGNNQMLLNVFGSSKAVTGALSTMGLQSETYAEVLDGMNNSQGNVAEGMKILAEDAGFKLAGAMNSVKLVLMDIGNMVMPMVLKAVKKIEDGMAWWKGLDENVKKTIVTVALMTAALGPLLSIVGRLTIAFSAMLSPIGLIISAFAVLGASIIWIYQNIDALTTLIANKFASEFGAGFWTAMGAAMKIMGIIGGDALIDLGAKMAVVVATGDDLPQEEFLSFTDIIKKAATAMSDMAGIDMGGGVTGGSSEDKELTKMPILGGFTGGGPDLTPRVFAPMNTELEKTKTLLEVLEEKFGLTKEAMLGFAEQTGTSLAQGAESFAEYGEQVKNSIREVISGLIAQGVAAAISGAMKAAGMNPIMIPVVAGLASGLAKTAFNSLIPAFADGGIVSGPTVGLMGEYAGAGAGNPEVIAPLNKLKGMMGSGQQNVVVEGRINGNDIWLSNSKTGGQRQRGI